MPVHEDKKDCPVFDEPGNPFFISKVFTCNNGNNICNPGYPGLFEKTYLCNGNN